jgi:hypothetical protein
LGSGAAERKAKRRPRDDSVREWAPESVAAACSALSPSSQRCAQSAHRLTLTGAQVSCSVAVAAAAEQGEMSMAMGGNVARSGRVCARWAERSCAATGEHSPCCRLTSACSPVSTAGVTTRLRCAELATDAADEEVEAVEEEEAV